MIPIVEEFEPRCLLSSAPAGGWPVPPVTAAPPTSWAVLVEPGSYYYFKGSGNVEWHTGSPPQQPGASIPVGPINAQAQVHYVGDPYTATLVVDRLDLKDFGPETTFVPDTSNTDPNVLQPPVGSGTLVESFAGVTTAPDGTLTLHVAYQTAHIDAVFASENVISPPAGLQWSDPVGVPVDAWMEHPTTW